MPDEITLFDFIAFMSAIIVADNLLIPFVEGYLGFLLKS